MSKKLFKAHVEEHYILEDDIYIEAETETEAQEMLDEIERVASLEEWGNAGYTDADFEEIPEFSHAELRKPVEVDAEAKPKWQEAITRDAIREMEG